MIMKTMVKLERLDRAGLLLEKREFPSHSFVKNFITLLYLQHAAIVPGSGMATLDVDDVSRNIDGGGGYSATNRRASLKVASPPGNGVMLEGSGYSSASSGGPLLNEKFGIVVGLDNTPVTITDNKLANRIYHGRHYDTTPQKYECLEYGDNSDGPQTIYASRRVGQLILNSQSPYTIYTVALKLFRIGSPGIITMRVRTTEGGPDITTATTNGDTLPTGAPYEWREFTLGTPVLFVPGTVYYIQVECTGANSSNCFNWRAITSYYYAKYESRKSTDGGTNWSAGATAQLIRVYGQYAAQLEYGGCDVMGGSYVNPNGSFDIRRYFTNLCGTSISVQEVGIYAIGCVTSSMYPFLIARDVVAPAVTVNNGEILRVTYVPQITV